MQPKAAISLALRESVFTEAETLEELRRNIARLNCHFEDGEKPKIIRLISFAKKCFPMKLLFS